MKGPLNVAVLAFILSPYALANGGPKMTDMDYEYGDELKSKDSAPDRTEMTRERMQENPRNRGFVESFGKLGIEENEQDQQVEQESEVREK
jgi:hypothetical protein